VPVADLAADLAALRAYEGPAWTVDAVHLVRSHLGPEPLHERVAAAPLDR
jgi:2'-5' RNA ligase